MYKCGYMDTKKYTTITIPRDTLESLRSTNENQRSANVLIQDLVQMHNEIKNDMGY